MHLIKKRGLVSSAQLSSSTFSTSAPNFYVFPAIFDGVQRSRIRTVLAGDGRAGISRWVFLKIRFAVKPLFRVVFPKTDLQEDVRRNARPKTPLVLQCSAIRPAICTVEDVSRGLDIRTQEVSIVLERFSILPWVRADTGSPGCPAHPGSLARTSRTLAAVIL